MQQFGLKSIVCSLLAVAVGPLGRSAAAEIEFSRDIRPILSEHCFACHGPDEAERQGGFRLDVAESALGEADSGLRPIVPGDPSASEVVERITTADPDLRMPPVDGHKALTDEQIDLLTRWVAGGAPWQQHWALAAPERPDLPEVRDSQWPQGAIDAFILQRLEAAELLPNPQADRATLLRRVTFDLTGLPSTPAELRAFLDDDRPGAYERVVDRLLESPHFGEHMARHWLDAARYGDTHGLHLDNYREMWPYRDWVVRAFNENTPFDQFTIEQLAGDLLPDATDDQLIATGFNRCHVTTNEGGSIAEEVLVRNVVDRVDTFSTVFLGLTMGCSRCHDHKYDPFTMRDYYAMFAYFNSLDGDPMDGNRKDPAPVLRAPTAEQRRNLAELKQSIEQVQEQLNGDWPHIDAMQREWERSLVRRAAETGEAAREVLTLGDWHWVGPFGDVVRYLKKRSHGPEGKEIDLSETFTVDGDKVVRWQRRPDWTDGKVHNDLPGNPAANFLYRRLAVSKPTAVKFSLGSDDGIRVFHNGREVLENLAARAAEADQETLELELAEGVHHLLIKILNYRGNSGFYFDVQSDQLVMPEQIIDFAQIGIEDRTTEQRNRLRDFYRNAVCQAPELTVLQDELKRLREAQSTVDGQVPTTLVWREREEPRQARMLNRGEYDQPGEEVARATPNALPRMQDDLPNDRLGLAQWLIAPEHPLFARVAVNRFWQQVFGVGLVETAEDFGSQGTPPSHPELLDRLACDFRDSRWDVKNLMKQLVTSATYRQASHVDALALQVDPANRLLSRGPRFRLDAEMLRDQALAVSGLLVNKIGGPSVKPPQPSGLWKAVGYSGSNTVQFAADSGPDKVYRRSLYTFIKRTSPPPQMNTFDGPSRESCTVRRERTNTPLQALLVLNDPQYVEAARGLAERAMREAGSNAEDRAAYLLQLAIGRQPQVIEIQELVEAFEQELARYRENRGAAEALIAVGSTAPDEQLDAVELAAWTLTANVVLNLDEVVTKN